MNNRSYVSGIERAMTRTYIPYISIHPTYIYTSRWNLNVTSTNTTNTNVSTTNTMSDPGHMNGYSYVFGYFYSSNQIEFRKTISLIRIAFASEYNFISQYIENIINLISSYTALVDFPVK